MKYKSPYTEPIVGRKEFIDYAEQYVRVAEDISSLKDFCEFVLDMNIPSYSQKNVKNWRKDALKALRLVNGRQLVKESEESANREENETFEETFNDDYEPVAKRPRANPRSDLDVYMPHFNLEEYKGTFPPNIVKVCIWCPKIDHIRLRMAFLTDKWTSILWEVIVDRIPGRKTAKKAAPCILHIDDIESMEKSSISVGTFRLTCFLKSHILKELMGKNVLMVGETRSLFASLPQSILDLFTQRITFGMLENECRTNILKRLLGEDVHLKEPLTLEALSKRTPGYEAGDLHRLVAQMKLNSLQSKEDDGDLNGLVISEEEVVSAMSVVVPSIKNTPEFVTVPDVTFDDIGGLAGTKQQLHSRFMMLIDDWEGAKALERKSGGVLLEGPPGCGKTLIAKALSNCAGLNFLNIKGPEVLNKYQGESERKIREIFERARACQPCLIFFDEIDAICPNRDASDSAGGRVSLVNQLLVELDGVDKYRSSRVFIVGATNRKDMIDPAILRSGRLGLHITVEPPSTCEDTLAILMANTKSASRPPIEGGIDLLKKLSQDTRTSNMTGADLDNLLDFAKQNAHLAKRRYLAEEDFEMALKEIKDSNKN